MNFRGHVTGAFVGGTIATGLAIITVDLDILNVIQDLSFQNSNLQTMLYVFGITWFMALFPDLDTASVVQRWFYRFLLVPMLITLINRQMDIFAVLAFLGVVPLLDKHRGWTHWYSTPWILAFGFAVVHEYLRIKNNWFLNFNWQSVLHFFKIYWLYILAAVFGHYIHLFLDSKLAKKLPLLKQMAKW